MLEIDSVSVAIGMIVGGFIAAIVIEWHNEGVDGRAQHDQRKDTPEA